MSSLFCNICRYSFVAYKEPSKGTVDKEGREGKGKTIRSLFRKDKND